MRKIFSYSVICIFFVNFSYSAELDNRVINKAKQAVVSITRNVVKSAYNSDSRALATGFLVNKAQGIILTNAHVVNSTMVSNLIVTFSNGQEIDAKFIYNDPLCDFAFLKVDQTKIPLGVEELKIAKKDAELQQSVFIIGNNEGQSFSIQTGTISSKYQTSGYFSCQSYAISLNTKGGSSGSPVLSYKGEVIALNSSGNNTFAYGINMQYIHDALQYIKNNKQPLRKNIGIIFNYSAVDKLFKYHNFPKEIVDSYSEKYPDALRKVVIVKEVFEDSPAYGKIFPGDVLWKVNGYAIGPNIYKMEKVINESKGELEFIIYRRGTQITTKVSSYDLQQNQIKHMINFGNAVFYESDEFIRLLTGAKLKSLFVSKIYPGSPFDPIPYVYGFGGPFANLNGYRVVEIKKINGQEVRNLNQLIKLIPQLEKVKNFTVEYINYFPTAGYNSLPYIRRNIEYSNIEYVTYGDDPTELIFDDSEYKWKVKKINHSQTVN